MDDATLLREYAASNSEAAFEALVSRYAPFVYSSAIRQTRDPHLAEEVTQAVFIILARKAQRISDKTILSGWFFKTTRFVAMAQTRTAARRRQYEQESHMQTEDQLHTPDPPLWEQISPLLDEALAELGKKDRQAVLLRFFHDQSLAEVGSSFGTGEDAARMRINRALEKLHRYFSRHGISSTTAMLAGAISANSVQAAPVLLVKTITAAAVAKGATAGGSTVALIHGALKLMAWSKAQTAAVAAAAVILAAGTTSVAIKTIHASRVAAYPDIQGAWEGRVQLDDAGVAAGEAAGSRVVLKFIKTGDGYAATADWIEKGRSNVPMGRVVYDYPSVQLEPNKRGIWNLKVNAEATQMTWDHLIHYIQPDPVVFTRTDSPDPVPEKLAESDFAPRADSELQGYWKGVLGDGPDALPVDLKIAQTAVGIFHAEVDSPMQGANGQPVLVSYSRPTVQLALASGAGRFQGKINNANTELTGAWMQDGQSTPTSLKRADYRAEHAQDAARDYTFTAGNDLQGHWKGSWVLLMGTVKVTIPLTLDIARLPDGSYWAALANIDEFGSDAPVSPSDFQYDPPSVRMKWKWKDGAYEGKLDHGKLVGTWFQGGGGFPLILERSGAL